MMTEKIFEEIIFWSLGLAVLLLPSFFLPITNEWFEWNKHYLLGILVAVALLAWLGKGLMAKKLAIVRSPLDLPLVGWLLVLLISGILSKDRIVSFFGQSENVSGGFLSFLFLSVLVVLVVWNIRTEKTLRRFLTFLGLGGGISALYFWLGRIGILKIFGLSLARWNPAVLLNTHFAVIMGIVTVLALGILLIPRLGRFTNILWSIVGLLSFGVVLVLGFKIGWITLAVGGCALLLFSISRIGDVRYPVLSLSLVVFVLSLVFWLLGTPQFLRVNTPTEITLAHPRSAQIAFDTLKEGAVRLFFGSGPDTFGYNFSEHRPASYNLSPTWNTRFSQPVASSFQILSGVGIIGSLAFLLLLLVGGGNIFQGLMRTGALLKRGRRAAGSVNSVEAVKNPEAVGLFFAVSAAWLTSAVMLFFVTYGTVLWLLFFILLALLPILSAQAGLLVLKEAVISLKATPQYALASSFIYIVVVTSIVIGGIFLGRFYGSDVLAVKAAQAVGQKNFLAAENGFARAIALNPYRVNYRLGRAETFLRHAVFESKQEKPNTKLIGQLVGSAINTSREASALSPRAVVTWEQLVKMYETARPFAKEANDWAVDSLNHAIELENTNAKFFLLRSVYNRRLEKVVEAEADIRQAIALKSNYAAARYSLSILLEQKKDLSGAIDAARAAVQFAPRALDAQFNLGRLLYNRNQDTDWIEAEGIFRRILSQNKDYGNAIFSLATLLERKGDISEAREFYNRALQLNPNNTAIKKRLDGLGGNRPGNVEPDPETLSEDE